MKMNANEVIESYVTDVALQVPRKLRNDVAFELRALIAEGLQDRADASGRVVDAEMAVEFLRAFGRPEEVAARYRPALAIIDPADGHRFLRASFIGLLIIWCLGFLEYFQPPADSDFDFLKALAQWWFKVFIPSFWWPGILVVGFGLSSWVGERWPQKPEWKPRASDRIGGGRSSLVLGVVGVLCGIFLLIYPSWILDFFWNGNAAPVAYQALTYSESFLQWQGPVLLALLLFNIPLFIAVIVKGRWSTFLRRLQTVSTLATCAAMMWAVLGGSIMMTDTSDKTAKFLLVMIVVITLVFVAIEWYRSVRPNPSQPAHAR